MIRFSIMVVTPVVSHTMSPRYEGKNSLTSRNGEAIIWPRRQGQSETALLARVFQKVLARAEN